MCTCVAADTATRLIETQTPCCSQQFGQQSASGPTLVVTDTHFVRDSESDEEEDDDHVLLAACEATEKGLDRAVAAPSSVW